jgi:hypothetical protein
VEHDIKRLFSWWNDGGSVNDRKEINGYIKKTKHNIRTNTILFSNECTKMDYYMLQEAVVIGVTLVSNGTNIL